MRIRTLAFLQWFGLLAGGSVWWVGFLAQTGASQAVCNPGSGRWGIPHDTVQLALGITGCALILCAEAAALAVFRATRGTGEQDPPPQGRLHFFAAASIVANVIFFMVILLATIATVVDRTCHQS